MAGYIGSKASVTQVDGYTKSEADDRYVNDTGDTVTFTSNEGDALLIEQADGTDVGSLRINNGSFIIKGKHSTNPVQIQTHDGNEDIEVDPDGFIKFETGGSERMRLTTTGLGIGTTNPIADLSVVDSSTGSGMEFQPEVTTDTNRLTNFNRGTSAYKKFRLDATEHQFYCSGSEKMRITQHGELIGPSSNDFDIKTGSGTGDMRFYTNGSQRARIDSNGALLVGASSFSYSGSNDCVQIGSGEGRIDIENNTTGTVYNIAFYNPNGNVGKITTNSSSTNYATSSDYRLKENVEDLTGAVDRLKQLAPKRFNFIADADTVVDGFLAHEAQAVVPEAVTGTHNEVDADGNAVMQGIDQGKLVPLLTAALQEAIAKIETLETKVAALEAG